MKKVLPLFILFSLFSPLQGQITDTLITAPPLSGTNTIADNITFEVSSTAPLTIKGLFVDMENANSTEIDIWYRKGGVLHPGGAVPEVTTANGWVLVLDEGSVVSAAAGTLAPVSDTFSIPVEADSVVGICLRGRFRTATASGTTQLFNSTNNYLTAYMGADKGYSSGQIDWPFVGNNFNVRLPVNIAYEITEVCVSPPVAGSAKASDSSVCVFQTTNLSLQGADLLVNQTYQWQSSPDNTNWTNISGETNPITTVTVTGDMYYRCVLTCGGVSSNSGSVLIETDGLLLSGTYTINSNQPTSGTNFESFADLIDVLNCGGLGGPVIVNVSGGPYNERVVFPVIAGASSTNTLTINGGGSELAHSAVAIGDRATIMLDGTDWLRINNLQILVSGASFGWGIEFANQADNNIISNCIIEIPLSISNAQFTGMGITGSGSYNLIEANTIIGGHVGISSAGVTGTQNVGNAYIDNTIRDFNLCAFSARFEDSLRFEGNDIHRMNRPSPGAANAIVFTGNGSDASLSNARIMGNRIHHMYEQNQSANVLFRAFRSEGLVGTASSGAPGLNNVMANNAIYDNVHAGHYYVFDYYSGGSDHWKIYHNTVVIDDPGSTVSGNTRIFYNENCTSGRCVAGSVDPQNNLDFKNNLFYMDRGSNSNQFFYYFSLPGGSVSIDHNAYYSPIISSGNVNFGFRAGNHADFAAWRSYESGLFDENAYFIPFAFENPATGNYKPISGTVNNRATNLATWVSTDIEGNVRPTVPDHGAWEFDPAAGRDMAILSFIEPATGGNCAGMQDVVVEVSNLGTDTVDTLYISWSVNGVEQPAVTPISVMIPAGNVSQINVGSFNISAGDVYNIQVRIDSIAPDLDVDPTNNNRSINGIRSGLSGQYTINQLQGTSGTNFASITEFANALHFYGVCGPVEVEIEAGGPPYQEQPRFSQIPGASATNTITVNGNGNEIVFLATIPTFRYVVQLDGVHYLTLDSLIISADGNTASQYGWGVWITNGASHNTIKNSQINITTSITGNNYAGIVMSGSGVNPTTPGNIGSYNTISNNRIVGGVNGISISSLNGANGMGHAILDNEIRDFASSGIYVQNQENLEIRGNTISRPNRAITTLFRGIQFEGWALNVRVTENIIRNSASASMSANFLQNGVYFNAAGSDTAQNLFANNMIYDFEGVGNVLGIQFPFVSGGGNHCWDVLHNTIAFHIKPGNPSAGVNSYTRAVMTTNVNGANLNIQNNIFSLDRPGTEQFIYYLGSSVANPFIGTIDHNGLYYGSGGGSNNVGRVDASAYTTFAQWQSTGFDDNSNFADPIFLDIPASDYTPGVPAFNARGSNQLSLVPEDINGVARTATPDFGAIEFTPLPCIGSFNLRVDSYAHNNAFLSWDSEETEWEIEWGAVGFIPGSAMGTIVTPINNNNGFELTGLSPDTCIEVYVRELCGSDTSVWSTPVTICTFLDYDIRPLGFVSPRDYDCGDTAVEVQVVVYNEGFLPATNFDVRVEVLQPSSQQVSTTYTGTLNHMERDTISLNLNMRDGGVYQLALITDFLLDADQTNDSIVRNVRMNDGGFVNIFASQDTICGDSVAVWVDPSVVGDFVWLNAADNSTLGTGDTLSLANVTQTMNLILQTIPGIPAQRVGARDTTIGNIQFANVVGTPSLSSQAMRFEVHQEAVLQSVKIYAVNPGMIDIALRDSNNVLVENRVVSVPAVGTGRPAVIALNMQMPAGKYSINARTQGTTIGGLLRNTSGASYPYEIPGLVTVTGNADNNPDTYHCFYDMVFASGSCPRPDAEYTIVKFDTPTASFSDDHSAGSADQNGFRVSFDAQSSSDGVQYEWDFGDGNTGSGDTIVHNYTQNGSFDVRLIVSNDCGSDTITETVVITGVSIIAHSMIESLKLYPNPTSGRFSLSFSQAKQGDVQIEFLDVNGKILWKTFYDSFSGHYQNDFDMSHLASGVYMLRINTHEGSQVKRVVLQ